MTTIIFVVLITHLIYSSSEPLHYIFAYNCTATYFLKRKIVLIIANYTILILPFIVVACLKNENWIWLIYIPVSLISVTNLVLIKYTFHQNNLLMKILLGINLGYFACTFINPILIGLYIISTPILAKKSISKMEFLLG